MLRDTGSRVNGFASLLWHQCRERGFFLFFPGFRLLIHHRNRCHMHESCREKQISFEIVFALRYLILKSDLDTFFSYLLIEKMVVVWVLEWCDFGYEKK